MSQANGFSPKRAHKYKVNASILASCTNKLQADFYLLNLSLQTKLPTLKKKKIKKEKRQEKNKNKKQLPY